MGVFVYLTSALFLAASISAVLTPRKSWRA